MTSGFKPVDEAITSVYAGLGLFGFRNELGPCKIS